MSFFSNNFNSSNNINKKGENTMDNRYFNANLDLNNPAPRCPVILLLDTSGSMSGDPIKELNAGLKQFIQETSNDEAASMSVELEVITFDTQVNIAMPFTPICDVEKNPAPLTTYGSTSMGGALTLAADELKKRRQIYQDNGIPSYKPWVVLMTDGCPNDNWEAPAAQMRALAEQNRITFVGVEIGKGVDHATMCKIMPAVNPMLAKLDGLKFKDFFRWLTDSMGALSSSAISDQDNLRFDDISTWGSWENFHN